MKWRCIICGYIHEGEQSPYQCPVCGAPAKMFERIDSMDSIDNMHDPDDSAVDKGKST